MPVRSWWPWRRIMAWRDSGERYDQLYVHIFKIRDGQIRALIECFDTALANGALWGDSSHLEPDSSAALSNLAFFKDA